MSPEELNRLASKEFSEILAADPVIKDLRASLTDRKDAVPTAFDALLMSGGDRIGNLPVLPLTAAKWTFLWICGNPFVSSGSSLEKTSLKYPQSVRVERKFRARVRIDPPFCSNRFLTFRKDVTSALRKR